MKLFFQILGYLPQILTAVKSIEDIVGAGNGQTKKQLVMNVITAAAKAGETVPEQHVQALSNLVDSTVATLNASGVLSGTKK